MEEICYCLNCGKFWTVENDDATKIEDLVVSLHDTISPGCPIRGGHISAAELHKHPEVHKLERVELQHVA